MIRPSVVVVVALVASGCVVPRKAGFDDVSKSLSARMPYRVHWNQGTDEDRQVAEERVKGHMASLGSSAPGEAPRNNKGNSLVQVRRTYERGVPVE